MKVDGKHYRTIWVKPDNQHVIQTIDQRWLPHRFVIENLETVEQAACAIREMHVRGAPLIGVTAAYGMYLAALASCDESKPAFLQALQNAGQLLRSTRPTAVNLAWAVERQLEQTRREAAASDHRIPASTASLEERLTEAEQE